MSSQPTCGKVVASNIIGYIVAIILTLLAFWLVRRHMLPMTGLFVVVGLLAIVQLFVQLFLFARIGSGVDKGWNMVTLLLAIIIIAIVVCGSLWIMYNLNYNMVH